MYTVRPSLLTGVEVKSNIVGVTVIYPGMGYFEVHIYFRGVEVTGTVTIVDVKTGQTIGTYTAPADFPLLMQVGTYRVYAYYRNYRATQTVEIREGETTIWRVYMEPRMCFIATAVYGYGNRKLETFRWFRDTLLLTNIPGRFFTKIYYRYIGKPVAELLKKHYSLKFSAEKALNIIHRAISAMRSKIANTNR